ncbi:hypothetical protein Zmor_020331 [Zophobas morio]|uniref:Uncharacterized protein n=1 Tax=Zophobas morio TaxID=2755281 RepID=A0AA38I5S5_9CUCU|nr:hypothetical protein Zmor_020331 [Zophobas morio]
MRSCRYITHRNFDTNTVKVKLHPTRSVSPLFREFVHQNWVNVSFAKLPAWTGLEDRRWAVEIKSRAVFCLDFFDWTRIEKEQNGGSLTRMM